MSPETLKSILGSLLGALNGLAIFIFTEVYNYCSNIVVEWENHKYESEKQNSFIIKTFIFQFFISYINLFYYAFIVKDFDLLSMNFLTIIITKNFAFIFKINLLPYMIFKWKKYQFLKKWKPERVRRKK